MELESNKEINKKICRLMVNEMDDDGLDQFLTEIQERQAELLYSDDHLLKTFVALRIRQRRFQEVYQLLQGGNFLNKLLALELWNETHYKERELQLLAQGRKLTNVIKFRIRQKFPLPENLSLGESPRLAFKTAKAVLTSWLDRHRDHPFPTPCEIRKLKSETKLCTKQIKTWFANARRRQHVRPLSSGPTKVKTASEDRDSTPNPPKASSSTVLESLEQSSPTLIGEEQKSQAPENTVPQLNATHVIVVYVPTNSPHQPVRVSNVVLPATEQDRGTHATPSVHVEQVNDPQVARNVAQALQAHFPLESTFLPPSFSTPLKNTTSIIPPTPLSSFVLNGYPPQPPPAFTSQWSTSLIDVASATFWSPSPQPIEGSREVYDTEILHAAEDPKNDMRHEVAEVLLNLSQDCNLLTLT